MGSPYEWQEHIFSLGIISATLADDAIVRGGDLGIKVGERMKDAARTDLRCFPKWLVVQDWEYLNFDISSPRLIHAKGQARLILAIGPKQLFCICHPTVNTCQGLKHSFSGLPLLYNLNTLSAPNLRIPTPDC